LKHHTRKAELLRLIVISNLAFGETEVIFIVWISTKKKKLYDMEEKGKLTIIHLNV
jgi:hypothetical protein